MSHAAPPSILLQELEEPTLAALGGETAVLRDRNAMPRSSGIGRLPGVLDPHWDDLTDPDGMVQILRDGLQNPGGPIAFMELVTNWLDAPKLLERTFRPLAQDLAALSASSAPNFIRASALEALLRLAERRPQTKLALLGALDSLRAEDADEFLRLAVPVVGGAYDRFAEAALLDVLDRLSTNAVIEEDVEFERALIHLALAFDAGARDEALTRMRHAQEALKRVLDMDPEHLQAKIYEDVLRCVLLFHEGAESSEISRVVDRLDENSFVSRLLAAGSEWRGWIARRIETRAHWMSVTRLLRKLAETLDHPSWSYPAAALGEVFRLYRGRPVDEAQIGGPGLAALAGPRIETSFLRREGLLFHLDCWLKDERDPDWLETAAILRRRISERTDGAPPGKR